MNRNVCVLVLIIFTFAGLVSGAIIVNTPHPGQEVKAGSQLDIKWSFSGCTAPKVKINIFKNAIAQPNFVLQLTGANSGSKSWQVPSNFQAGKYILRVKTEEKGCFGDSGLFNIVDNKTSNIGIIQAVAIIPTPNQNIPRHRAPAIEQPSNASFSITKIYYDIKKGKLANVKIMVKYNSKTAFSFNNYNGDPKDGPAYMNCKISFPRWPCKEPMRKTVWDYGFKEALEHGPPTPWIAFNQRLSVKYGGANHLKCEPQILNPGSGYFQLIFTPVHAHKIMKLHVYQKKKVGPFSAGDLCIYIYLPKIEVRLFIHTKEGVISVYKQFYLDRIEEKTLMIPGEVSSCIGGVKYW